MEKFLQGLLYRVWKVEVEKLYSKKCKLYDCAMCITVYNTCTSIHTVAYSKNAIGGEQMVKFTDKTV